MPKRETKRDSSFPATQWSLVAQAGDVDPQIKREALASLLQRYTEPMKSYLVHRRRLDRHKAEDLVQSFVASKVLEKDLMAKADQGKGRFRSFLLTALDRFVFNQLRDEKAPIRRPEGLVSLEDIFAPDDNAARPEDLFDVAWARQLLQQAIQRMKQECETSKRPDIWGVFEGRILMPTLEQSEPVPYGQLVKQFNFASPAQASNVLITANRMFTRLLKAVVGEYENGKADVDAELADLREILSRARAG